MNSMNEWQQKSDDNVFIVKGEQHQPGKIYRPAHPQANSGIDRQRPSEDTGRWVLWERVRESENVQRTCALKEVECGEVSPTGVTIESERSEQQ